MKNILLVGPYPPPYGGIATLIVGLAPHLAQQGYNVTVLSLTAGQDERFSPHDGVEVLRMNARRLLLGWRSLPTFLRRGHKFNLADLEYIAREIITTNAVRKLVQERHISLVSSYMITSSMFVPRLKREFGDGVKFATTIFGELIEREEVIKRNLGFYSNILSSSDQVLATSRYCASLASMLDYDPSKVRVIYVGVDPDAFSSNGPQAGNGSANALPEGRRTVMFLGRFHEEMGLDVILNAVPQVVVQKPDVYFMLIGAQGPLSPIAERLRDAYPNHLMIHQNAPFDMLPSYYASSEILLAPTADRHACMGVSIKEAMVAEKAIITTNSGGVPEAIIDGDSGIVLDLRDDAKLDEGKLVDSILYLLDNPAKAAGLGKNARQRAVEMFDNKICWQQHLDVVQELIGEA